MTSGGRPPTGTLVVSLLVHCVVIGFWVALRLGNPPDVRSARVVSMSPLYLDAKPIESKRYFRHPVGLTPREFRPLDSAAPSAPPHVTALIPDPPVLQMAGIPSMEPAQLLVAPPPPPVRRVVAAGVFDTPSPAVRAVAQPEIATGNFGDATAGSPRSRNGQSPVFAISTAAEILSKPRPQYSDEARGLRIEGEVLLEVLFAASGEARVLRTVRGLGHGLDENAIAAARAIHFRPAESGGMAVDSTAVVHIVFQLAF